MNTIIINITLGIVFGFCTLTVILLCWPGNSSGQKSKRNKRTDAPAKNDGKKSEENEKCSF